MFIITSSGEMINTQHIISINDKGFKMTSDRFYYCSEKEVAAIKKALGAETLQIHQAPEKAPLSIPALHFTQLIDLRDIRDSLELESCQTVAILETPEGKKYTLEVRGEVRIVFNGTAYKSPDSFPDELKELIHEGAYGDDERVYVDDNNWFELFDESTGESWVAEDDIAGMTPGQLLQWMLGQSNG